MTRVISADCHVNEPPWVFDRVPGRVTATGRRGCCAAPMAATDGASTASRPSAPSGWRRWPAGPRPTTRPSGLRFDEILPGNYDGAAHVADMELDGIDVSVVYPAQAIFTYVEPDRGLAIACMQSYNDWLLDDFQGADPKRIVGLPLLPVEDGIDVCVAELDRVLAKGARAAFIPGSPTGPYHDPYYEPFWAAVAERGVPLTYHRTFGGKPQEADWDNVADNNFSAAGTVHRFLSLDAAADVPGLQRGLRAPSRRCSSSPARSISAGCRSGRRSMDEQFRNQQAMGTLDSSEPPSELLGRNIFVTVLDDHVGFKLRPRLPVAGGRGDVLHRLSAQRLPVARQQRHVAELTADLSPEATEKILHGNAARVYGV